MYLFNVLMVGKNVFGLCWNLIKLSIFNPLTAGAAYIRVFIFY